MFLLQHAWQIMRVGKVKLVQMKHTRVCSTGTNEVLGAVFMNRHSNSSHDENTQSSLPQRKKKNIEREDSKKESQKQRATRPENGRIVVGMKINDEGQDLLQWTLTKFAQPGDSIFVVHVIRTCTSSVPNSGKHMSKRLCTDEDTALDFVQNYLSSSLALKNDISKVRITVQVQRESHVYGALVDTARKVKATSVVLGKSNLLSMSWYMHSTGRYCVKNLSPYCKVMIVNRGKVVLHKAGSAKGKSHTLRMLLKTQDQVEHDNVTKENMVGFSTTSSFRRSSPFHIRDDVYQSSASLESESSLTSTASMATDEISGSDISYISGGSSNFEQGSPNSVLEKHRSSSLLKCSDSAEKIPGCMAFLYLNPEGSKFSVSVNDQSLGIGSIGITLGKLDAVQSVMEKSTILGSVNEEEDLSQKEIPPSKQSILKKEEFQGSFLHDDQVQTDGRGFEIVLFENIVPQQHSKKLQLENTDLLQQYCSGHRFSYQDLQLATGGFSSENLVGAGASSTVYKGNLLDQGLVAIKVLSESIQGEKEFFMEIAVIARVRHQNLVRYIGFCVEGWHRLLVFEFLQNGNLQQHLHGDARKDFLNWEQRQKVALDAARGLEFLHSSLPYCIIHRDVKSSNILLTEKFEAQVSDFGLATFNHDNGKEASCSGIVGTFGYMAPEYILYGTADEKTDVHSFGVVLLEIISGRPPIDTRLSGLEESLVQWARYLEKQGEMYKLVDPRLSDTNSHQLKRMMYAAFLCIKSLPEDRPNMKRVVSLLDPYVDCTEPLLATPSSSTLLYM